MIDNIKYLAILFVMMIIVSCSKDIESPEVSFTADKVNVQVGETVTFTVTGDVETYAIFTGDSLHNFENSHLAITEGMELDQEEVVLTADSLVSLTPWLTQIVENYNSGLAEGATPVRIENLLGGLEALVGKQYTNKETAAYEAFLVLIELSDGDDNNLAQSTARDMVDMYYEDHSVVLAPEEGFSTGFAINRYEETFEYAYSEPGTYTATLIATDVSDKIYSGSGYQDDRTSSADEYDIERTIKELTITVQPAE